jgi:hypothetical protein
VSLQNRNKIKKKMQRNLYQNANIFPNPPDELENSFKYKIMSDIIILKDYKKKLEKKISDNLNKKHQKTASVSEDNSDIDFIEDVYDNVKSPFYYIMDKVNILSTNRMLN